MFGLGMTELLLIAAVALIVVGPKRLPDIAKSLGKGYGEFKRSFGDFKESINLNDDVKNTDKPKSESTAERYADRYRSQWEQKTSVAPKAIGAVKVDNKKTSSNKFIKKSSEQTKEEK